MLYKGVEKTIDFENDIDFKTKQFLGASSHFKLTQNFRNFCKTENILFEGAKIDKFGNIS